MVFSMQWRVLPDYGSGKIIIPNVIGSKIINYYIDLKAITVSVVTSQG